MQRKKKIIIAIALVLVIAIVFSVWFALNKPHRSVEDEVSIPVTAIKIFSAYTTNETTANNQYLDKTIAVTGEIMEIKKNQEDNTVLVLKSEDPLFGVACTMKKFEGNFKAGDQVTIIGICSGFTSDVVLRDCIVSDSKQK
jgi:uncharacterized protein YpmB